MCNHTSPLPSFISVFVPNFYLLVSVSDLDIQKGVKRLRRVKSAGLDDISGFIIRSCSTILLPILKYIFNPSVSPKHFPTQWKQSVIVSVYKKDNNASVKNCRSVSLLNNFSKFFEFVLRDCLFYYFKNKLYPFEHGFFQSRSTSTNLASYLDYITRLVCAQHQVDAVYFDLRGTFGHVPHSLLLHKLSAYRLSEGYISWLCSYVTNRYSFVRIYGIYLTLFTHTHTFHRS